MSKTGGQIATSPNEPDAKEHRIVSFKAMWVMFAIFIITFIVNLLFDRSMSPSDWINLLFFVWLIFMSAALLKKHGLPRLPAIAISLTLAGIAVASTLIVLGQSGLFVSIIYFVITFCAALALFSVSEAFPKSGLCILRMQDGGGVVLSILLGLCTGAVLGAINALLMQQSQAIDFQITLPRVLFALEPAIVEEIAMRALFFCFCVSAVQGRVLTKQGNFTIWFMMVVPHVMVHTPEVFITGGLIAGLVNIVILAILFGLPLAILQRKRDLVSAMIAHGTIDAIRFCLFGLPL